MLQKGKKTKKSKEKPSQTRGGKFSVQEKKKRTFLFEFDEKVKLLEKTEDVQKRKGN